MGLVLERLDQMAAEWTNQLATRDTEELKPLLDDLEQLKAEGLIGAVVAISFCHHLIQPLQDQAHPAFEYWVNPTRPESHNARSPRRR
jgi:hypothetical protein